MKIVFFPLILVCLALEAAYPEDALLTPVAFAQVREDPLQDLQAIQAHFHEESVRMLMVASGGDTAAYLLTEAPLCQLDLVDPNPSQLALTKLKIHLLHLPLEKRLQLLGHRSMETELRKQAILSLLYLLDLPQDSFGPIDQAAQKGIDFSGRYERVFQELREQMRPKAKELQQLFFLSDIEEQSRRISPETPLGRALDSAFQKTFSQGHLVAIFGDKATANRVQEFSSHFAERTRQFLSRHLASSSPYFASMFLGHFLESARLPWLQEEKPVPSIPVTYHCRQMNEVLRHVPAGTYHVIHLSNILDWLSPQEARETLDLSFQALRPGGIILVRQLNSNLDIPLIGSQFAWDLDEASRLEQEDRSFFYRNVYIARKPSESPAPLVQRLADRVLEEIPVIRSPFFHRLQNGSMTLSQFQKNQAEFFYAVDYFSRPMAALIARLPHASQRADILHNIVEEHGDFDLPHAHCNTFVAFLERIGVPAEQVKNQRGGPISHAFNQALMGACVAEDPLTAIACNGIIEYAFADISALIGEQAVKRGWISREKLIHYSLHAAIDKRHAAEFFALLEPRARNEEDRDKILAGLRLGAEIFRTFYDRLDTL